MASGAEVIFAIDTGDDKQCLAIYTKTKTPIDAPLPNGFTVLTYAIRKRNRALAMQLLDIDAGANAKDKHGFVPIYYAVRDNFLDVSQKLLQKGADIIKPYNADNWSPLHLASKLGYAALVKLMIAEEAYTVVNLITVNGQAPLHLAAIHGSAVVCKDLMDKGAVVDAKDTLKGQTPLHKAAMRGNIDACLTLIKHGARLHEPDTSAARKTPLELARDFEHFRCAAEMTKNYKAK